MIRRGGTTSALALGMARASRREGQGCECHPRSVRWVWVWPGVTSANTLQDCTPRECRAAERVLASSVRMLRDLRLRCGEIVHLVLYRRNVRCSVRVLKNSLCARLCTMGLAHSRCSLEFSSPHWLTLTLTTELSTFPAYWTLECQTRHSVSDMRSARKSARRVTSVSSLHRR